MRVIPSILLRPRWRRPLRGIGGGLIEGGLLGGSVMALEAYGARATDDAADIGGLLIAFLGGYLLVGIARRGGLVFTPRLLEAAQRGLAAGIRFFDPPCGVAFRLPEQVPVRGEARRLILLVALAVAAATLLVSGGGVYLALGWIKAHVGYTVYLLLVSLLWGAFGAVSVAGLVASGRAIGLLRSPASSGGGPLRLVLFLALWVALVLALARLPGVFLLAALGGMAISGALRFVSTPGARPYYLYRQDDAGALRSMPIHRYLGWTYGLLALALLLVAAAAHGWRLFAPLVPQTPFRITQGLGLVASAGALVVLARVGARVRALFGPKGSVPEALLVPRLWWPGGDHETPWTAEARRHGWVVDVDRRPRRTDHDLVVSEVSEPRSFEPDPDLGVRQAQFRLERRFHVVKRREFFRRLHVLHKDITKPPRVPGCGYLFCPHAWPVPGVVRDVGAHVPDGEGGRFFGGVLVGRPYAEVFPSRVRRYVGGVLRALDLDLIYWEDGVGWADLRRVFGVLFETFDQGRLPARDRHFICLPRVVALIQEPDEVDDALLDRLEEAPPGARPPPPPLRARILVIRRDGGGREAEVPDAAPSTREPAPATL